MAARRGPGPQRRRHPGARRRRLAGQRPRRILAAGRHPPGRSRNPGRQTRLPRPAGPHPRLPASLPQARKRPHRGRETTPASRTASRARARGGAAETLTDPRRGAGGHRRRRRSGRGSRRAGQPRAKAGRRARQQAEAIREATSLRLVSEAQSMLAGTRSGGDVRACQQLLVARRLAPNADEGPLFTALAKRATCSRSSRRTSAWGVAFSPDGERIVSGSCDKTVRLWDADTGQPIGQPLTGHTDEVNSVAFSPDGTRIVSGSDDNTVRVWDADTGQPIGQPLTGHTDEVNSVAFSPDGTRIVSGSGDKTVRLWDADTGQPIGEPLTGHTDEVYERGVQPRRQADRLRQRRQHRAAVGRGHRPTRRPAADRAHERGVQRGVQPRRARGSSPAVPTRRCGCGTPTPASPSASR